MAVVIAKAVETLRTMDWPGLDEYIDDLLFVIKRYSEGTLTAVGCHTQDVATVVMLLPLCCRIHQAEAGKAGPQWVLQHEFCAGTFSRCTALCWRDHSVGLPPMLLFGTEHGAQVRP